MENAEPINTPRTKSKKSTAAGNGQSLHSCLEVYSWGRGAGDSHEKAYSSAMGLSKELGCMPEFCRMDFTEVKSLPWEKMTSWYTELAMCLMDTGQVRRIVDYEQIPENAVFAGTADLVYVVDDTLYVVDWKTGLDDVDDAERNDQLLGLSYMLIGWYVDTKNHICKIINPVSRSYSESIKRPNNSLTKTNDFISKCKDKEYHKKEFAGDWCRYCPLKSNCQSFFVMSQQEVKNAGFQDRSRDGNQ